MDNITLTQISAEVDAAYAVALAQTPPQKVVTQQIGANATLRTDLYTGPQGSGFLVVATVDLGWRSLVITRQHGPETGREQPAPTLAALVLECQEERARRYNAEASVYDLADAETKLASPDPAIEAAGAVQKSSILARRLQFKAEVPKPQ